MLGLLSVCEVAAAGAQEANRGTMGPVVVIEPVGGYTGGATPAGPLRMQGRIAWSALSKADQARVDALFARRGPVNANLRYRLTRDGPSGPETVEAPADAVPEALINSIKTTID
jgi:hypothetical protein